MLHMQNVLRESYIYYWSFDGGKAKWIFGDSPTSAVHDIELIQDEQSSEPGVCIDTVKIDHFEVKMHYHLSYLTN